MFFVLEIISQKLIPVGVTTIVNAGLYRKGDEVTLKGMVSVFLAQIQVDYNNSPVGHRAYESHYE
jgi:hypothetical protein